MGGKKGFLLVINVALVYQHFTLQSDWVVGLGCCWPEAKRDGLCVNGRCGVTTGVPIAPGPARWAPTNKDFRDSHGMQDPFPSAPGLQQRHHMEGQTQQDLSLYRDAESGHGKAMPAPDHILCLRSRGGRQSGWLLAEPGRETWARAAAASHAPSKRCYCLFHYTGFLIKTERGFFSRK